MSNKNIIRVKKDIVNLLELLNLAEESEISISELGKKLNMSPQNVNSALQNSFQAYIRKSCKIFTENDIEQILFSIETPSIRLLRDIFEYDTKCLISFPEYDEEILWSVVEETLPEHYFSVVCKRTGFKQTKRYTFDEIAKESGTMSKMRASAIYANALIKLRSADVINQIFGIEYINKINEIKEMQTSLINKYNEEYNTFSKLNSCMSNMSQPVVNNTTTTNADLQNVLDVNITELGLSNRTYNCLYSAGYTSVLKICRASAVDIICIDKLGKTCIQEIINKVDKYAKNNREWNVLKNDLLKITQKLYY